MDLIPVSYRKFVKQLHILRIWTLTMFVILALSVTIHYALGYKAARYQAEIVMLEGKEAVSSLQDSQFQELQAEHKKLAGKLDVLMKLRGGAAAENMFVAVDRALNGKDVWFTSWRFDRTEGKTRKQAEGVDTGYFIIIAEQSGAAGKPDEMWKIGTRMEVTGGATDHEALSSFVRRLLQQPRIGDVRIQNTRQHARADKVVVDFTLVITVNNRYTSS